VPAGGEDLLEAMTAVSRYLLRIMTQCLGELPEAEEVSATQYRALGILALRGPRNASELAEELGVGRPAATKLVDRLVRRRLIRRRRHPTDRRQVILEATERGREVVRAVQLCRRRRLARALAALDPAARDALARDLPALVEAFERTVSGGAPPPELLPLAAAVARSRA
jgi:DNA-binding MarR family transcriptional regulator